MPLYVKDYLDERRIEKRKILLDFLRHETFTTVEIAGMLLGIQRNAAYKTLRSLRAAGVLESHQVQTEGWGKTLWGTTPNGAAEATPGDEEFHWFEPGRISPATLAHDLWLQKIRVRAEAAGWKNWLPDRALRRRLAQENQGKPWLKVPDALAVNPDGETIAVEVERSIKNPKRYQQIMAAYLQMAKGGLISRIEYVCVSPVVLRRLPGIFRRTEYVLINGDRVRIEERHHAKFSFFDVEKWPL